MNLATRRLCGAGMGGLLLALGACASETTPPPPAPAGAPAQAAAGPPRGACRQLFVSPSGEPFRSDEGGPCPLETWFAGADANHDGALDLAEFTADASRFFATLDVDHDGVLGPEEVERYERVVLPEISGRRAEASADPFWIRAAFIQFGGGGGGGGGLGGGGGAGSGGRGRSHGSEDEPQSTPAPQGSSPDGASRYGLLDEPEPVAGSDLNFDGRITRAEFLTRAGQRFATLDAAGTGQLTLARLQARMAARSGERPRSPGAGGGRGRRRS